MQENPSHSNQSSYSSDDADSDGPSLDTSVNSSSSDVPHVVFVSIGHPGQTNPMIAIAHAYQKVHPQSKITFATSHDLGPTIESQGFGFLGLWESAKLPESLVEAMNNAGIRSVECMLQWALFSRSRETYIIPRKLLVEYIESHGPSLIICDSLSEAGMAAAIDTNTKFIVNSPTPPYVCFPDCLPRFFPTTGTGTSLYKTSVWHSVYDFAVSFRYKLGLYKRIVPILVEEREKNGILLHHESAKAASLFINNTSESFSDPRVNWPEGKMKWIGVALREDQARLADPVYFEEMWEKGKGGATSLSERELYTWVDQVTSPSSKRPLILVALGTLYKLDSKRINAIYTALSSLPVKVLWKIGRREQEMLPKEAIDDANFRFETWIPDFMLLLAHPGLKLFVNHAGGNSLHEGLYFGKPMICIPGWMDCFDFAMRTQDLGAGLTIDTAPSLDMAQFQFAVKRVLLSTEADNFLSNAQRVASDLKKLGGAFQAVKHIDQVLQQEETAPIIKNLREKDHSTVDEEIKQILLPPC